MVDDSTELGTAEAAVRVIAGLFALDYTMPVIVTDPLHPTIAAGQLLQIVGSLGDGALEVVNVEADTYDTTALSVIVIDSTGEPANTVFTAGKILGVPVGGTEFAAMTAAQLQAAFLAGESDGVLRNDSGALSVDADVTDLVSQGTTSLAGKWEGALSSEVTTGSSTTLAVTPDALRGSDYGTTIFQCTVFGYTTDVTTGDGAFYITIPTELNGYDLVGCSARVITAGTTNTTDIQIRNVTQTADMLTTKMTIDSTETGTSTAATPAVIDTNNDDVASYDLIAIDVDATSTTKAKGLIVNLKFRKP